MTHDLPSVTVRPIVAHEGPFWTQGAPTGGNGANTALRDADLLRRRLIEAGEGRRELLDAVDDYERQMFEYGAEAVRSSLEKLPAFAPEAKLS
ncbi:hypothetical protein ACFY6U_15680 [Streptomyces sp. NPDC013157]|uniref:hypothetical protein n=1 Tax=Streptomyces sp. NPDC013157 TaxID=3364861 RepID=UPI0036BE4CC6